MKSILNCIMLCFCVSVVLSDEHNELQNVTHLAKVNRVTSNEMLGGFNALVVLLKNWSNDVSPNKPMFDENTHDAANVKYVVWVTADFCDGVFTNVEPKIKYLAQQKFDCKTPKDPFGSDWKGSPQGHISLVGYTTNTNDNPLKKTVANGITIYEMTACVYVLERVMWGEPEGTSICSDDNPVKPFLVTLQYKVAQIED